MADLMHLRSFIAIYRSGSIKKASQYLNLSQPAVSGQLRALETQIGRDLFTRTSRGIIPTAAGNELARSSGPHIDALELLGERAQISDYEGTVHLGGPIEFLACTSSVALLGQSTAPAGGAERRPFSGGSTARLWRGSALYI